MGHHRCYWPEEMHSREDERQYSMDLVMVETKEIQMSEIEKERQRFVRTSSLLLDIGGLKFCPIIFDSCFTFVFSTRLTSLLINDIIELLLAALLVFLDF